MPKITIGIPTYNRLDLLKIMASSLYRSDLSLSPNIRIYDDCSTDFDEGILKTIFPTAKSIKINNENLKADKNIYQMYVDFLSKGDDYFFNADSDIIFTKEWLNNAIKMIEKTDGILTLFNTNTHKSYKHYSDLFCLKQTIGSAGTIFKRDRVYEMINHFDSSDKVESFDWQWCEYFANNGLKIYSVNDSLIQHIGYTGQNLKLYFDIGKGFNVETIEDGQTINNIFVDYIDNITLIHREYMQKLQKFKIHDDSFFYHFLMCIKIIARKLLPKQLKNRIKALLFRKKRVA